MLRWISEVPPAMVPANERRYCTRPGAVVERAGAPSTRIGSGSKWARSHSVKRLGPGTVEVEALEAERLGGQQAGSLLGLAREELEDHVLGRHLATARLGEAAVAEAAHGGGVDGQPADGLGQARVVAEGAAAAVGRAGPPARAP